MSSRHNSGGSADAATGGGGENSKDQKRLLQSRQQLMEAVTNIREDDDLCDVSFLVGKEDCAKRTIRANSTVLALRSPYFRAMCFGPMKNDRKKVISDMSPETFEKVLDFVHASNANCFDLASTEEAWELRYASCQFLLPELAQVCEEFLRARLTHRNALQFLRQATANRSDEFRRRALRVMKNRHISILSSDELKHLEECDVVELIKLFKHVKTDYIIKAVFIWGGGRSDQQEFKEVFRSRLFRHVRWDNLSNANMLQLHEIKMLPLELENEAMIRILGRTGPLPEDSAVAVCCAELSVVAGAASAQRRRGLRRVLLRTAHSFDPRGARRDSTAGANIGRRTDFVMVDQKGVFLLNDVLQSRQLRGIPLDSEDVEVEYDVNHSGLRSASEVAAEAFQFRVDNRDAYFISVTFKELPFENDEDADGASKCSGLNKRGPDEVFFKVSMAPEMFKDLADGNLRSVGRTVGKADELLTSGSPDPVDWTVRSWRSSAEDGEARVASEDDRPRYFFEGCGVPVFVAFS